VTSTTEQKATDFRVRDVVARPGEKGLRLAEGLGRLERPICLPLISSSTAPSPASGLLAMALQHGDEVRRLRGACIESVPSQLRPPATGGTLVAVPCMNLGRVRGRQPLGSAGRPQYEPPLARPQGRRTLRASSRCRQRRDALPGSDYAIDMHGGTMDLEIMSYVSWVDTAKESALPLAYAAGIRLITGDGSPQLPTTTFSTTAAKARRTGPGGGDRGRSTSGRGGRAGPGEGAHQRDALSQDGARHARGNA